MTKVAMLTYAGTAWDSRIRRFVLALGGAGFTVSLVSADQDAALPGMTGHFPIPALSGSRRDLLVHLATAAPSTLSGALALPLHRLLPSYRATMRALRTLRPDIIHANDWVTLPAALDAAAETGARVIYDSHEFAVEEHHDRLWWRYFMRPHVAHIERDLIGKASAVMTVGHGLAQGLRQLYGDQIARPLVIRNLPESACRSSPMQEGASVRLVYAGLLRPERRIDVMIDAVGLAGPRFTLDLIGFGPDAYVDSLSHRIVSGGLAERVRMLPPVPQSNLIAALSAYDVGLFLSEGIHGQQLYALPNKIFEYIAAGLAIVSFGSHDVAELIASLGNGISPVGPNPEHVAATLATLSTGEINGFKARSGAAALDLTWESEAKKLVAIYQSLV